MNKRILSWNIKSGIYAYIFKPDGVSHISAKISENDSRWPTFINSVNTEKEYENSFTSMKKEVAEKYGITISGEYTNYWNYGGEDVNVVLLYGGGDGSGSGSGGENNGGYGPDDNFVDDVYAEIEEKINQKLNEARQEIMESNERVKEHIATQARETLSKAQETLSEAQTELNEIREDLTNKLSGATEALNKAADLFELGEGYVTPDAINEVFTSVSEYSGWVSTYSGFVVDFKTDYDIATERMGTLGTSEDATDGLFSKFATSLNAFSGTVSTVESTMNASQGLIQDIATWYNTNESAVTNAMRFINASGGQIVDSIEFINGEGLTTKVAEELNAMSGLILTTAKAESENGLASVKAEINALSASMINEIVYRDPSSAITSVRNNLEALSGTLKTCITKTNSAMSLTMDLRETWDTISGKVSTVSNMVAKTDENGNILYYAKINDEKVLVYKDPQTLKWKTVNGDYEVAEKDVFVEYSEILGSYIQQEVSGITLSVVGSSSMTAAIRLAVTEDAATIKMIADEVVIDATMIANAISANSANIGGIYLGKGVVECAKKQDGKPLFKLNGDDGTLSAQKADIEGNIRATGGKIGGFEISANTMYVKDKNIATRNVALLNGSDEYADEECGKVVLAAGIIPPTTFYKHELVNIIYGPSTCEEKIETISKHIYKEIYTMELPTYPEYGYGSELDYFVKHPKTGKMIWHGTVMFESINVNDDGSHEYGYEFCEGYDIEIFETETGDRRKECLIDSNYRFIWRRTNETIESMMSEKFANTIITEDGTIKTNTLTAEDGFFGGEINSNGVFYGKLKDVNGTFRDGELIDCAWKQGEITLLDNDTFEAWGYNNPYLTINKENIEANNTNKYYTITPYSWYRQNSNGTNAGIEFTGSTTMAQVYFNSGATITIPTISYKWSRYIPTNRNANQSHIWVKLEYSGAKIKTNTNNAYKDNNTETIVIPYQSDEGGSQGTIHGLTLEATGNGWVKLKCSYNIHLPTYSWLGADKAAGSFNITGGQITVKYPENPKGMFIGRNGFKVVTSSGFKLNCYGSNLSLMDKVDANGITITTNGIIFKINGEEKKITNISDI